MTDKYFESIEATSDESVEELDHDAEGRKLYDPRNPGKPIFVKSCQDERNAGDFYIPHDDEAYNSNAARERFMAHAGYQRKPHSPKTNYSSDLDYDRQGRKYVEEDLPIHAHVHNKSYLASLKDVDKAEMYLSNMLSNPSFDSEEFKENLARTRNKLKSLYETMILADIDTATHNQVEQSLWKNVFYQVIEVLRENIRNCAEDQKNEIKEYLALLLDQSRAFYENLLENLQRNHRFNLKEILQNPGMRKKCNLKGGKRLKLALLSCQRTFISLGDIARYREQVMGTLNYGQSRHSYLQAQILAPKNGRPYNQLAILAVKTRHKLDAVYYYVRSLCASNPILTARESLMGLFDEIRRKFDYIEKKNEEKNESKKHHRPKHKDNAKDGLNHVSSRTEIWLLPGQTRDRSDENANSSSKVKETVEDFPELNLPVNELMKHFMLIFLNIHGKQFTRVGLEDYSQLVTKMLRIFNKCLPKFSMQRMLQIFTINMFSVSNASTNSIHGSEQETKQNMERALRVLFSMLALVVDFSNKLLQDLRTTAVIFEFTKDNKHAEKLTTMHAVIKTVFDWMFCNKELWYNRAISTSSFSQVDKLAGIDIWHSLCELADWVCDGQRILPVMTYLEYDDDLEEVFLPEEVCMSGFTDILETFSDPKYIKLARELEKVGNKINIHICVRLEIMRDFLEYLCGMDEPVLAFKEGKYIVIKHGPRLSSGSDQDHEDSFLFDFDSGDEAAGKNDNVTNDTQTESVTHSLGELKMYHDSLKEANKVREERRNRIEKSLNQDDVNVTIEIKPKKLVPDTNCFIDHLPAIKAILKTKKYFISVPIVVVKELEGLSKEVKSSSDHAISVCEKAKIAVVYIREMVSQSSLLCPLTSSGTEIHTLQFMSEEINAIGTNDDFILKSAESLAHKIDVKNSNESENLKTIYRTVVLLTEDRNLRLKSLMHDVPCKSIKEFCKWAKI